MLEGLISQHETTTGSEVRVTVADTIYGTAENYLYCLDRGIDAHMHSIKSVVDRTVETHGHFPSTAFHFDPQSDTYTCPAGKTLRRVQNRPEKNAVRYAAQKADCQACPLRSRCTSVQSSIAQRIRSIDGFGPICSATLAGELGNIDRFASESSLALYCGMTRLNNDSGLSTGSKNTRQVNTHARSVMMIGVARHIDAIPESKTYYDKKRSEGKTHNQAVRALGRHLIRVIWSMLKNDRDYVRKVESSEKNS